LVQTFNNMKLCTMLYVRVERLLLENLFLHPLPFAKMKKAFQFFKDFIFKVS
jgi:hypothetical protein